MSHTDRITLISNGSASSAGDAWPGGQGSVFQVEAGANWNGATIKLQKVSPNGTWIDIPGCSLTADGQTSFVSDGALLRAAVSGGPPSTVYAYVSSTGKIAHPHLSAEAGSATETTLLQIETAVELIDDAIKADDAAFVPATTKVMMAGFEFDDTTPDSVDEGDAGAARMSARREQYMQIRDAAGNERGVNVDASNQAAVVDAAVKTAVEIMDDWDESDRAKVNPIVGQAGIGAGTGAVGATVTRVTDAKPAGIDGVTDVTLTNGVETEILAADTTRLFAMLVALSTNTVSVRVGGNGSVAAGRGIELVPGGSAVIPGTGAIAGFAGAASQKVTITKITD